MNQILLHRCIIISLFLIIIYLLIDCNRSKMQSHISPLHVNHPDKMLIKPELENTFKNQSYFLHPLKTRLELGGYFSRLGFRVGAELGVAAGENAYWLLHHCRSCKKLYLIDVWEPQQNYKDVANGNEQAQRRTMRHAKTRMKKFGNRTEFIQGRTDTVVKQFPPSSLDFIYLDARHDYCAVSNDLELWWPVLRPGGIFAGHDYMDDKEVSRAQDWTLCEDGSRQPGTVKRAVDEFAMKHQLVVSVMYRERMSNSYMIRKPFA